MIWFIKLTYNHVWWGWSSGCVIARLLRLSVCSTSNKEIFRYQLSINQYRLSVEKVSFISFFTDIWSRSSFQVMTCMFFSADVGKTTDCVLTTHPLQAVIKLSFVANDSASFCVHCFACWTSPEVILFSGSFHLLQDPGYRVWFLANHTKRLVSASTWYWWLYFLLVLGKHLQVKKGICWSSGGSGLRVLCQVKIKLCTCTLL